MKTITTKQAVEQFDEYSDLAHNGEKVLVTRAGQPLVALVPPAVPRPSGTVPPTTGMAGFRRTNREVVSEADRRAFRDGNPVAGQGGPVLRAYFDSGFLSGLSLEKRAF